MVPQTTTQISRPLPPSRPIPPTPPRGTVYVVERFGRFSRLLPGNGPPLLPLVDRVIAAYARRVDQATPSEGVLAVLLTNKRVVVHAKWSIRITDPRKLAYRISDIDRCVDMLVHVRIRDVLSTLLPTSDLDDPAVLRRIGNAIRLGVDDTAARFGVSCPHFKVLSLRPPEEKPQRTLNLADVSSVPDYYTNGIESVLPELPRDATDTAMQSSSSHPSLPPPHSINYPQPIAYPQPPQPPRRPPALASVRPPPPLPSEIATGTQLRNSDDESLELAHDTLNMEAQTRSFQEASMSTSPEDEAVKSLGPGSSDLPNEPLSDPPVSGENAPTLSDPSLDQERQTLRGPHFSDYENLAGGDPLPKVLANDKPLEALHISEDEAAKPLRPLPDYENVQELPRDTSTLTDDTAPPSLQLKREVLYAPPPSPSTPHEAAVQSSVLPEELSDALVVNLKKSAASVAASISVTSGRSSPPLEKVLSAAERTSPPAGRVSLPVERVSPPTDRISPPTERVSPPQQRASPPPERVSPPPERVSPPPERVSPPAERVSPPAERVSPPAERVSPPPEQVSPPPEKVSPPPEQVSLPPKRVSPPPKRVSPPQQQVSSPPERASPPQQQVSPPPERASPPRERISPPPMQAPPPVERVSPSLERVSPPPQRVSPLAEGALPLLGDPSPPIERATPLPERESPLAQRTLPPLPSPSEGFSPPLASILSAAAPTPHSDLPSSERGSDSSSDSREASFIPSPAGSPTGEKDRDSREIPSKSSELSFDDAVDHPMPSTLMLPAASMQAGPNRSSGQAAQASRMGTAEMSTQGAPFSQVRTASVSFPLRSGEPLLGPPMIPMPMETARDPPDSLAAPVPCLAPTPQDTMPQLGSTVSDLPRAPTPPMMPLSTPVREAASGQNHVAGNWQGAPVVAAEGLAFNVTETGGALPLGVGTTHAAEVDSRVRHAIPQHGQQFSDRDTDASKGRNDDGDYSSTQPGHDRNVGSDSDDTNIATRGRPLNSPPLKREPRKRRQHVQTASLFSSVVGKAERAIKTAGTALASDLIDGPMRMMQTQANSPRIVGNVANAASKGVRIGLPATGIPPKPSIVRNISQRSETEAKRQVPAMHHASSVGSADVREGDMHRRGLEYIREESHPRRDGKRLRTTEEEEDISRKEHARREKLMDELDKIGRNNAENESSDGDSTQMMIDEGSDEEREKFNDEVMSQSGAHLRRRREKASHRRRHTRHEDDAYDSDVGSSSDETCTECGRHHNHDDHGSSSSIRKSRSKSRSKRSEGFHHDRSDHDSDSRSASRSRGGRERKGTNESSVDSHRSGRSSSHDRHRHKKSGTRDRKIDKQLSSSTRNRSRDGKRSHSKSRSSSRKREAEDKKRKDSKSKSKHRDKRGGPTPEQLEYKPKETRIRSIYRHRLPESDSGPENPIPWYCEGQSQPEDTDLDDYPGSPSSDSDGGKRSKITTTVYSSYGSRNRYGHRHRAHHNRSVRFLYDDQY